MINHGLMTYREFFKTLRKISRMKPFLLSQTCPMVKLKNGIKRPCYSLFYVMDDHASLVNPFTIVLEHLNPGEPVVPISSIAAHDLLPCGKAIALLKAWRHQRGYSKALRRRLIWACRIGE